MSDLKKYEFIIKNGLALAKSKRLLSSFRDQKLKRDIKTVADFYGKSRQIKRYIDNHIRNYKVHSLAKTHSTYLERLLEACILDRGSEEFKNPEIQKAFGVDSFDDLVFKILTEYKKIRHAEGICHVETVDIDDDEDTWIIGDLHGMTGLLGKIFKKIDATQRTIFMGDNIDRGKNEFDTIMGPILMKLLRPEKVFVLAGNHEYFCMGKSVTDPYLSKNTKRRGKICNLFNMAIATMRVGLILNYKSRRVWISHGGIVPEVEFDKRQFTFDEVPSKILWGYYKKGRRNKITKEDVQTFTELNEIDLILRGHVPTLKYQTLRYPVPIITLHDIVVGRIYYRGKRLFFESLFDEEEYNKSYEYALLEAKKYLKKDIMNKIGLKQYHRKLVDDDVDVNMLLKRKKSRLSEPLDALNRRIVEQDIRAIEEFINKEFEKKITEAYNKELKELKNTFEKGQVIEI